MIERHYHKGQLLRSYDFNFRFCPPNTTNEWEGTYEMPELDDALKASISRSKDQDTVSDSFYFVGSKLIMHNKASYQYVDNDKFQHPKKK